MVERLKEKPFALVGINSDGDRDVLKTLDEKDRAALATLGKSGDEVVEQIRQGEPEFLAKVETAKPGLAAKVRDLDLANLRKILEANKITWKQAAQGSTRGPMPRRWNVSSWPTIYVLDAKGVIRFKNLRGEELEEACGKLIAELEKDGKR